MDIEPPPLLSFFLRRFKERVNFVGVSVGYLTPLLVPSKLSSSKVTRHRMSSPVTVVLGRDLPADLCRVRWSFVTDKD